MSRRPHDDVADWPTALSWLRKAWHTLPVPPSRLHDRDIEDGSVLGSHRFSSPMWRILNGTAYDVQEVAETVQCGHHRLEGDNVYECRDCHGEGWYENRVARYRSPMAAAMSSRAKMPRPSDGTPAPVDYIAALYHSGWQLDRASRMVGVPIVSADHRRTVEAMFLLAVRRLRNKYSEGPLPRVGWVDRSESQRNAEDAA